MNHINKIIRLPSLIRLSGSQTGIRCSSYHHGSEDKIVYHNANNYQIPVRPTTHDDLMVPYGSFEQALEAERKLANKTVIQGIISFIIGATIFYKSGVMDGLWMPNLDNIMEESQPMVLEDKEGRITV